jgi:hypothetical protein
MDRHVHIVDGLLLLRVLLLLLPGELASAKSVVVYAGFKAAADSLAAQLQRAQVTVRPYHAGLNMQQRESVQVGAGQRRQRSGPGDMAARWPRTKHVISVGRVLCVFLGGLCLALAAVKEDYTDYR